MSDVQNRKQTNKNRGKQESGRRDTEDIRKTQMELLKIKNIMYEVKNTLDGINKKLDTSGEKANELEDTAGGGDGRVGGTERLRFGEGHGSPLLDLLLWEGAAWHGGAQLGALWCPRGVRWQGLGWWPWGYRYTYS